MPAQPAKRPLNMWLALETLILQRESFDRDSCSLSIQSRYRFVRTRPAVVQNERDHGAVKCSQQLNDDGSLVSTSSTTLVHNLLCPRREIRVIRYDLSLKNNRLIGRNPWYLLAR